MSTNTPIWKLIGPTSLTPLSPLGSGANETIDGLDASAEALRHAVEDTPSGASPQDAETVPVFDR